MVRPITQAVRRFLIVVKPGETSTYRMLKRAFATYPRFTVIFDQRRSRVRVGRDRRKGAERWTRVGFAVCERIGRRAENA